MFIELVFVLVYSFLSLFVLRKAARKIGLVDKPDARKHHEGAIPLVGGIAICLSIAQFLAFKPELIPHSDLFLGCIVLLTIVGALDDRFDLSVKVRIIIQTGLSILMLNFAGMELLNIGNLIGDGNISLGILGPIATVVAVIGAINAFNMVDGIDGLLGGLSITTFAGISFLLHRDGQLGLSYLALVVIVAMIPYIFMNLGILGRKRKVFMGDAGSMVIGFTVIWLLLEASQDPIPSTPLMRPVTGLWLIAVPLMDMAAIMIRRIRRGDSPFKPDREHLHHIFQRLGFSSRQTLLCICAFSSCYVGFGIYGEVSAIAESTMFMLFMICFVIYAVLLSYVWRITSFLRGGRKAPEETVYNNNSL